MGVAEQAEAGDVGQRVRARRAGLLGGAGVERRHDLDRRARRGPGEARPRLSAVAIVPAPSGLVSTSTSPGAAARVGQHRARVDDARDREPVLRLRVVDRVPADDRGARRRHRVRAAAQDLAQHVRPERLQRVGDEVQRADTGVPPIA